MSLPMKNVPVPIRDELAPPPDRVNRRFDRARDALWRLAIRFAYRAFRLWWFFRRPAHRGALVALWHAGELLLVRSSYRRLWTLPGGGVGPAESARDAALRELREEIGLDLPASALRLAYAEELFWECRHDHVTIFEVELAERPRLRLDNREILAAAFLPPAALAASWLTPHLPRYLAVRRVIPSSGSRPAAGI
ncbi:MAG: NUDIX domain-containing protein [Alphaproteobacteria bacterium]|nr:NUDIX domain-containing protein [Alphaproteobacteria bacterium]